jgi:hypothetical protein
VSRTTSPGSCQSITGREKRYFWCPDGQMKRRLSSAVVSKIITLLTSSTKQLHVASRKPTSRSKSAHLPPLHIPYPTGPKGHLCSVILIRRMHTPSCTATAHCITHLLKSYRKLRFKPAILKKKEDDGHPIFCIFDRHAPMAILLALD